MPNRTYKAPKRPVVKRKPLSKAKVLKRLKLQLWELCRAITEKRYPNICFTCDKPVSGSNRQLGHCIPSSVGGISLRYHLDNLRWQCYYDNINLGGHGSEYYRRLVEEIGQERVNALFALKREVGKADKFFFENKITEYQALLSNLQSGDKPLAL